MKHKDFLTDCFFTLKAIFFSCKRTCISCFCVLVSLCFCVWGERMSSHCVCPLYKCVAELSQASLAPGAGHRQGEQPHSLPVPSAAVRGSEIKRDPETYTVDLKHMWGGWWVDGSPVAPIRKTTDGYRCLDIKVQKESTETNELENSLLCITPLRVWLCVWIQSRPQREDVDEKCY